MTLEDAINYPRNREEPLQTILIGGVLSLLGFLFVPLLFVAGYLMRVLGHTIADDPEPPTFDDWGDLLMDGVRALVVGFVYVLIPAIVFGASVGGLAVEAVLTGDVSAGTIAGSLAGFFLSSLLFLGAWYVLPAALANAVSEDRLGAGFSIGQIRPVIFSGQYAVAWGITVVLFVAGSVVVGFLSVLPPLGLIVGAFLFFYLDMVAAYLYGRAYTRATRGEAAPQPPTGQPTA